MGWFSVWVNHIIVLCGLSSLFLYRDNLENVLPVLEVSLGHIWQSKIPSSKWEPLEGWIFTSDGDNTKKGVGKRFGSFFNKDSQLNLLYFC